MNNFQTAKYYETNNMLPR